MFKKIVLFGGLILGVLLAAYLVGNGVWIWTTGDRLEAKLTAIRAAGDPVTLPDLARPDVSPDDNAAVRLQRARKDVEAMTKELNALTEGNDYRAGKLTEEDRKKLKSLLDAYPHVLKLLEEAGACSTYDAKIDYTVTPDAVLSAALGDATDFRAVINLLEARCRLQVAEGQQHEALQTCLLLFRLSRLYDGSQFIIQSLVSCAGRAVAVDACNRVLRAGPVTEKDRQALEAELALHDSHEGFVRALKKERAFGISSYDPWKNPLNRAFFNNDECQYLDLAQEQIDLASQPYDNFVTAVNKFKATKGGYAPLAGTWVPAAHKTREAVERVRGVVRCLRVLNALQSAGVKPDAGAPEFSALKLPQGATADPFTDKRLRVKIVAGDWLIYTVGPDLKDDDGDLAGGKDFGVGPAPVRPK